MRIGVIGTGIMGSNLAKCLSSKGIDVNIYSRSYEKAVKIASEIGGKAYDDVKKLVADNDAVIVFVTDDSAVLDVATAIASGGRFKRGLLINASTVVPSTSIAAMKILRNAGVNYLESPVYGSGDEARECRLLSMVGGDKNLFEESKKIFELYSQRVIYVGEVPKAMTLKLALNHIGLSIPGILAESLALLTAWDVDIDVFREVAKNLWFGSIIERYWSRVFEERPPRFKTWMAGKDYMCIASALKEKRIPSIVAEAMSTLYMMASSTGYREKDYPQIAKYFIELANKTKTLENS
ncbi:MAG: NAD(P)-dependent oxidoreductase [Ignisphaera sp.]